ncbi:MAG: hypothetical protein HRF50_15305 [Phycisphaerae bacterium]
MRRRGSEVHPAAAAALVRRAAACCCALLLGASGCAPGINWRLDPYDRVQADAARDGKLTFVYFREWADPDCTEFEEFVLKDPAVRKATTALYCVPLSYHWDQPLAEKLGVSDVPAVAVLDTDGRVLMRLSGKISKDLLLQELARVQRRPPASQTAPGTG